MFHVMEFQKKLYSTNFIDNIMNPEIYDIFQPNNFSGFELVHSKKIRKAVVK